MVVVNAVEMAHKFIISRLTAAKLVIDATAGNGKDTLFLAKHTPPNATVFAFDIQPQAIANTELLLNQHHLLPKAQLILDSHANIANYIDQPIDVAMFNLGYLPGGDHTLSTCSEITKQAISQTLQLLTVGGLLTVAAYPGYEHGKQECHAVHQYLAGLSQQIFTVASWAMVNQTNSPPVLYIIEKKGVNSLESSTSLKD
ncbi:MAG: putative rRNA methylase [Firmicutes bacterium]|nr:putative rRNA methylase [Bacillota bacterium]